MTALSHEDTHLVETLQEIQSLEEATNGWETIEEFDRLSPLVDRSHTLFNEAVLLRSRTQDGIRAKAELLRSLVNFDETGVVIGDWLDRLALSLADDILQVH